ncbi:transcription factor IIA, alpha/beta subunit-domain-containing protein [Chytridium lagenaria]|nr:transcription factor IIA, alpha/beta subunit-domain-containing protein [Chytridium lagenaria]
MEIDEQLIRGWERAAERRAAEGLGETVAGPNDMTFARRVERGNSISQVDGDDDDDEDDDDEDEDDLNSELDEDDSDEDDQNVTQLVLCQLEKKSRIRNKWKLMLKDCMINVSGKDYLFSKANCDFEW